jgi:hypothetical protein
MTALEFQMHKMLAGEGLLSDKNFLSDDSNSELLFSSAVARM